MRTSGSAHAGPGKWVRVGWVKTDRYGRFAKSFVAKRDGYWRAGYRGGHSNLPGYGPGDYVDVR